MLRNVRLLALHNFLNDFRPQLPFLVVYFAQVTGSYFLAMAVPAAENLVSAAMDIPTGVLSDRIGRKPTLLIASAATALSAGLYACAHGLPVLLVGAAFSGLGQCLFNGNNNALLFESLRSGGREEQFHHYQGWTRSMFQLALGLSAFCSSLFTAHGLRFLFVIGIVPQVLSVFVGFFFREPRVHTATGSGFAHFRAACIEVWRNGRLRLLIVGQAISYAAGDATFQLKGAFVNSLWPTWAVGVFRGFNHALGFLGYWFAGRVLDRVRAPVMLAVAEAYWFISQGLAVLLKNFFSPILLLSGLPLYGPFIVARDHLLQKEFTDAQRAAMGSVASFLGSLFSAVVALGIGLVSDRFGLAVGVGCGVVASVCSLPFYLLLFRRYFRQAA